MQGIVGGLAMVVQLMFAQGPFQKSIFLRLAKNFCRSVYFSWIWSSAYRFFLSFHGLFLPFLNRNLLQDEIPNNGKSQKYVVS